MIGTYETLHKSSKDLHKRFGNYPPGFAGQTFAFEEEVKEFLHEVNNQSKDNKENLLEEALDVIVTISGILMAAGITIGEIQAGAEKVAEKNNKKTTTTHILDVSTKKIRRKTPKEVLAELNGEGYETGYLLIPKPGWVDETFPKPIMTEDETCVLAQEYSGGLKNTKYVACHAVYSKGVIAARQEFVNVMSPCVHDKEKLLKVLLTYSLIKAEPNNDQMGESV